MQFEAKLPGEAAALARAHDGVLRRLPATVHAFILIELQKWPTLFPAEQRYQRALVEHLSQMPAAELQRLSGGIATVENDAAVTRIPERDPARFQDLAQAAFRKQNALTNWRREVDHFFQQIDPALAPVLFPADAPRRLVLQLYAGTIAVQPASLWSRLGAAGLRIPLKLDTARGGYLDTLFGVPPAGGDGSSLFGRLHEDAGFAATDSWIIESHDVLHRLVQRAATPGGIRPPTTVSYDRLRPYRDALMQALFRRIQDGVESPQAFAAYARSLKLTPDPEAVLNGSDVVHAFLRDVLLTGNGTLFVNNTFAEWAAVQALRRAQPRLLVVRYGVRDKLKPFSSLLLFSRPRESDRIPLIEDPVGSFVDVEQLSYYVWLNAQKTAAYQKKTLYLFLAESGDEMLAIRSDMPRMPEAPAAPVALGDVCATIAEWLGVRQPARSGRPIAALVG